MDPNTEPTDDALEQALRGSRSLESAPQALIERAIALMPAVASAPMPRPAGLGGALRRLVANLVLDSGPAPALALGLRSTASSPRQVLWSVEGRDIDLRIAPADDTGAGWVLSGQVLGPDLEGEVRLVGDGVDQHVALSDLAEFRFGPVPTGRWQLSLHTAEVEIELPALDIPGP